ncbi:MAG: hypothetical protein MUC39_06275 [Candidatus Omnitrophica bacterium]|jgi:multicomponent Na+:H+ antiporter subunit B|nr:hypothetical protein [Candidatus Omnitrophota bacterium]
MKNNAPGMTLIVKVITRLTVGLILLYGFYIVLHGHIGPGGGFAGGVIMALSLIHLMLAYGKEAVTKKIGRRRGIMLSSIGAVLFLALFVSSSVGFIKFPVVPGGQHIILGAGVIPFYDIAISIMVGAGLYTVFLALVILITERDEQ